MMSDAATSEHAPEEPEPEPKRRKVSLDAVARAMVARARAHKYRAVVIVREITPDGGGSFVCFSHGLAEADEDTDVLYADIAGRLDEDADDE